MRTLKIKVAKIESDYYLVITDQAYCVGTADYCAQYLNSIGYSSAVARNLLIDANL
jgi:hypothetical protein